MQTLIVEHLLFSQEASDDITITSVTQGQLEVVSIKEEPPDPVASTSTMGEPSTSSMGDPSRQQQMEDDDIVIIDSETTMAYLQGLEVNNISCNLMWIYLFSFSLSHVNIAVVHLSLHINWHIFFGVGPGLCWFTRLHMDL